MPDVSSTAPEQVRLWICLDVHKHSIVAASLPPVGGTPQLQRIENSERAIRRFVDRLGGPAGLAVAYEAGPCGFDLLRLLGRLGVACDVIAPSLVPVRAGDRVKTDRRDAKKLVRRYRAGELTFVEPPSPQQEGLRDLCAAATTSSAPARRICRGLTYAVLRAASARAAYEGGPRRAARHRIAKALLRHGHIFRDGKKSWTRQHYEWVRRQRLDDELSQRALAHMLCHLDSLDAQIAVVDHELEQIATLERWSDAVGWLCCFRGISTRTALGLLAEIGDFRRFRSARELMSYLGLTPTEYSSGEQQHRGHITKCGNQHARRLLVEAAWHYRHAPRRGQRANRLADQVPADVTTRAWQAQIRLHHRHRTLAQHGKRSTVTNVAVARELTGFVWAAMTHQPLRDQENAAA